MAKDKAKKEHIVNDVGRQKGFTDHHGELLATGSVLVGDSRPRGKPYRFEEWLTVDRKYRVVKVYDAGELVVFEEIAKITDPKSLAGSIK
jgi:hypothetical protein